MAIPSDFPKITYGYSNQYTLWLPAKFVDWDNNWTRDAVQSEGHTYIQTVCYPTRFIVKAKTAPFRDRSEAWTCGSNVLWTLAWQTFWLNHASLGNQFRFYRKATDGTSGTSLFDYCVWTGKDHGLGLLRGAARYQLDINFKTEGASR